MVSVSESFAVGDDRWGLPMERGSNGSEMPLNSICLRATGVEGDDAWRYNIEGCLGVGRLANEKPVI